MKGVEFYRNLLGLVWFFSAAILYFTFIGMGLSDTISKIMAGIIWTISAFPVARIVNLIQQKNK